MNALAYMEVQIAVPLEVTSWREIKPTRPQRPNVIARLWAWTTSANSTNQPTTR